MRSFRRSPKSTYGRKVTTTILKVLEAIGAEQKRSVDTASILNIVVDNLEAGGRFGIFTTMNYLIAHKPFKEGY